MTLNEQATQNLKDIKRILDSLLVYIKLKEGAKLFNGIIRYNIRCHCMESDYSK